MTARTGTGRTRGRGFSSPGSGPLSRAALTSLAHALAEQGLGAVSPLATRLVSLVEQGGGFLVALLLRVLLVHLICLGPLQRVIDHTDQVVRDVACTGRFRSGHRRFSPRELHVGGSRDSCVWSRDPLPIVYRAHAHDELVCKFLATHVQHPFRLGWLLKVPDGDFFASTARAPMQASTICA